MAIKIKNPGVQIRPGSRYDAQEKPDPTADLDPNSQREEKPICSINWSET